MTPLTGKQKNYLRGLGHSLKPLLQIGKHGVTDSFLSNAREALLRHELIKVKLIQAAPLKVADAAKELEEKIPCHVAQTIGKTILIYSPNPEEPVIQLPK